MPAKRQALRILQPVDLAQPAQARSSVVPALVKSWTSRILTIHFRAMTTQTLQPARLCRAQMALTASSVLTVTKASVRHGVLSEPKSWQARIAEPPRQRQRGKQRAPAPLRPPRADPLKY